MIGFGGIRAAAAPYMLWIVLGAIAAAGALGAYKGYQIGTDRQASVDAKIIAEHVAARAAADEALRAAGSSLRAVNAEADRRRAEVAATNARADAAKAIAQASRIELRRRTSAFDRALAEARAVAGCSALLDMDVGSRLRACGVVRVEKTL